MSYSLRPQRLQHPRPPCPSPTPRAFSNSCPLSQWCHPTISSSFAPFSSRLQCFLASGSFQMSQFFRIRWAKYWSFSFNISPSNECLGLISFRMDWVDLLAVQGTLKSLLQHHSSKASILWCSAFFIVQLSHLYMTTEETIAFTRWTFVRYSAVRPFRYSPTSWNRATEITSFPLNVDNHSYYSWITYQNILKAFTYPTRRHIWLGNIRV